MPDSTPPLDAVPLTYRFSPPSVSVQVIGCVVVGAEVVDVVEVVDVEVVDVDSVVASIMVDVVGVDVVVVDVARVVGGKVVVASSRSQTPLPSWSRQHPSPRRMYGGLQVTPSPAGCDRQPENARKAAIITVGKRM